MFDTEYDQAKVPPYNGSDPTSPLEVKSPFASRPIEAKETRVARHARELRRGTSSIHLKISIVQSPVRPAISVPEMLIARLKLAVKNVEKLLVTNVWTHEHDLNIFGDIRGIYRTEFVLEFKTVQGNFLLQRCPKNCPSKLGNGQNTVSRATFRKRELTEFFAKLGEFCEKKKKNSVSSFWHTNNMLKGPNRTKNTTG